MYHCWLIRLNRVNVWKCNESFVCNDCANSKGRMAGMKWWWKRLPTDQTWWTHGHILEIRNTQSPRSTSRAKWEEVPLLWGGPSGSSLKDCPDFLLYFLLRFKLVFHGFHKYFSRRRRNLPIFLFFFFVSFFIPNWTYRIVSIDVQRDGDLFIGGHCPTPREMTWHLVSNQTHLYRNWIPSS